MLVVQEQQCCLRFMTKLNETAMTGLHSSLEVCLNVPKHLESVSLQGSVDINNVITEPHQCSNIEQ